MITAPLHFNIPAATTTPNTPAGKVDKPTTTTRPTRSPGNDFSPAKGLEIAAANRTNLHELANHLRGLDLLWNDGTSEEDIASALAGWKMPIASGSTYTFEGVNDPSLTEVITRLGFEIPSTRAQAVALRDLLDQRALAPLLGNAGGALSWPVPLLPAQQQKVNDILNYNTARLPGLPLAEPLKGALGYLMAATPLSPEDLQVPHKALEKLLSSPQAHALGLAIQRDLEGISTPFSLYEHVLSAIHLGLDRESIEPPHRSKVAGFDLAQQQLWGKPASDVVDALKKHLVSSGKASQATAHFTAHLLLARVAPQFLVKDIPDRVAPGSQAWVNFYLAVAKVEAEAPGVSSQMTFAQIMLRADLITDPAPEHALHNAVIDWALASGLLPKATDEIYTPQQLEVARAAFNERQNQRMAASEAINAHLPTRKEVALAILKERFPDTAPGLFEKPVLQLDEDYKQGPQPLHNPNLRPVGLYFSMLDIFMGESTLGKWKTQDTRIPIDKINNSPALGVHQAFNTAFTQAIETRKSGVATTVRHLISQLPLEDRQKLETGKISFFHESTYDIAPSPDLLKSKNLVLSFKVEQGGQRTIYELDIQNLSIRRKDNYIDLKETTYRDGNLETRRTEFKPKQGGTVAQGEQALADTAVLDSFSSPRSHLIANAFVEHLEYDNPAIKQEASGATPHEQQLQAQKDVGDFFLNLIPFRSAIVNFAKGNYAEGALDLGMDIFGFLTAGVGAGAKLVKVGSTTASAGAKFIKGAKVIGVATLGAINPLDGVGDLATGAARTVRYATTQVARGVRKVGNAGVSLLADGMNSLRGTSASHDVVKAGRSHGVSSIGTFKVADQTFEGVAVQRDKNWYAYDPTTDQPFGGPLNDFQPSYTLDPTSPRSNGVAPHSVRHTPYSTGARPARARTPLPQGEYASAMKGKLEADHFKPDTKHATMKKFTEELRDHYSKLALTPPVRPVTLSLRASIPTKDMLEDAFKMTDGLVLGERHNQMASFRTLFDSVDTLKRSGVKRVYFEGLLSRPDLPGGLQVDGIDKLIGTGKARSNPSFKELQAKLEANGIEVLPLDHYYLTRHKDARLQNGATAPGNGSIRRLEEFNYYAAKTIEATSNGEKWVALVGLSHMKTSEGVPGLAEMTGSTAVGVFEHNKAHLPRTSGFGPSLKAADPSKPITADDFPGDLRIFVKARPAMSTQP
ncbi:hypothetical protein [Pseudomonas sp. 18175]|uniref:membrane-targeted effector domain-containing toxin n=1 Tax=Pseudomonas sp. 18175 TaxID=3390056 RepID=UPI003D1A76BE